MNLCLFVYSVWDLSHIFSSTGKKEQTFLPCSTNSYLFLGLPSQVNLSFPRVLNPRKTLERKFLNLSESSSVKTVVNQMLVLRKQKISVLGCRAFYSMMVNLFWMLHVSCSIYQRLEKSWGKAAVTWISFCVRSSRIGKTLYLGNLAGWWVWTLLLHHEERRWEMTV